MDNDEGASLTVRRLAADCRIISSPTRLRADYEIAALFGSIRRECGAEGPSLPSPYPFTRRRNRAVISHLQTRISKLVTISAVTETEGRYREGEAG